MSNASTWGGWIEGLEYEPILPQSATGEHKAKHMPSRKKLMKALTHLGLSDDPPISAMHGEDTLTIGDQLRWKQAYVASTGLVGLHSSAGLFVMAKSLVSSMQVFVHEWPRVTYRNSVNVRAFLEMHPEVQLTIRAAWPSLTKAFGTDVEVVLEVIQYQESESTTDLVGWIQCYSSVDEALARYESFEEEWVLDNISGSIPFNFNLECR